MRVVTDEMRNAGHKVYPGCDVPYTEIYRAMAAQDHNPRDAWVVQQIALLDAHTGKK